MKQSGWSSFFGLRAQPGGSCPVGICALVLCLVSLWTGPLYGETAVELRLDGDRLWLNADGASVRNVLESFVRAGVRVKADPELSGMVNGTVQNANIEQALDILLDPLGYVLIWDVLNGPLGAYPKLSELHVFKPGRQGKVRHVGPADGNVRIARWPDGIGPLYVPDEILIGFSPDASLEDLKRLLSQLGGTVLGGIPELGIYRIRLPAGANIPDVVEQLGRNPLVAVAEPNYVYRAPDPAPHVFRPGSPAASETRRMPAPVEGVGPVAILDSGLTARPELAGLIAGGLDALDPGRALTDPAGHGTQMALIAAGAVLPFGGFETEEVQGLPIVAVRIFDDRGATSNYHLMRSIVYAIEQGSRVINLSWGSETRSRFLADTLSYARANEVLPVAAAGNDGVEQPMYPAAYPGVIGIGATNPDGTPWAQSNRGAHIYLAAPGVAQFSVGHQGPPGQYAGTSISSAYVTRALGLYFMQNPGASIEQALNDLKKAVAQTTQTEWNPETGHGILNDLSLGILLGN